MRYTPVSNLKRNIRPSKTLWYQFQSATASNKNNFRKKKYKRKTGPIGRKTAKNGYLCALLCQKTLFKVEKSFTESRA